MKRVLFPEGIARLLGTGTNFPESVLELVQFGIFPDNAIHAALLVLLCIVQNTLRRSTAFIPVRFIFDDELVPEFLK